MNFFARMFGRKAISRDDILGAILAGDDGDGMSASGKRVTIDAAIKVSTVFACARVIAEGVAQVPFKLMRKRKDGRGSDPVTEHPLYDLLATSPNDWMTSFEYREMIIWHAVLAGNHYSYINRSSSDDSVLELIPLEPKTVAVKQLPNFTLEYRVTALDGSVRLVPAKDIWHIRGPSWNGWQGLDAVKLAREAIGLALVTEESVSRLHKNGVRTSGTYSVEGSLTKKQYDDLTAWLKEQAGVRNTGVPMIVDRSAKWLSTRMTGVDAQTLENRRFQIEEMCRFARVMPIMVGFSDKATTYASAEQMFIAHMVHTLAPWYQRIEQSADKNLLTPRERAKGMYTNFVEEGLIRGSIKDTKDTILGYVNGGVLTPNEGRALLDKNPMDDAESDKLRIPSNIVGNVPDSEPTAQEVPK